ncbi:ImmA/IrrE family metallo-endopeptidase [Lactiplantibacillus sp. WILCCON 0030]|uniref:ImmA/IrrE family metallo-endopeptidase n=1 Tax=Lactiplantibacillus brownii TaxID=3069269 RepID=A0ABU1AAJ2_9LACO|nr:ImmA/IrrE family metallo-endopeptidase [Lactiplantibacillus brownii]MDQ7937930.1 ImmA/IrrE family metallo-endopeptidase [Lactiplantibacillus brownii]
MKLTDEIELLTDSIAEKQANSFVANHFGDWIFIGASIETVIMEQAVVIYQDVADPEYFGATIRSQGISQVAINTRQNLRNRYSSVAHELWHLLVLTNQVPANQVSQLNNERAADHFAASVMLPEMLVKRYWQAAKHQANFNPVLSIIQLADLSAMPYVAVTRRLRELGLRVSTELQAYDERAWKLARNRLDLVMSPLDEPQPIVSFSALKRAVLQALKLKQLTLDEAATMLTHAEPTVAAKLWAQRRQQLNDVATHDD